MKILLALYFVLGLGASFMTGKVIYQPTKYDKFKSCVNSAADIFVEYQGGAALTEEFQKWAYTSVKVCDKLLIKE